MAREAGDIVMENCQKFQLDGPALRVYIADQTKIQHREANTTAPEADSYGVQDRLHPEEGWFNEGQTCPERPEGEKKAA